MPNSFKELSNCRIIIDFAEFLVETPRMDLEAAAASYSNCKSRLATKYLIAVAPNVSITFVSEGFPGSTSDNNCYRAVKNCFRSKAHFTRHISNLG